MQNGTHMQGQHRNIHMQQQSAHVSVLGPVLVLVVTWCWQWTHVRVTGLSLSSVGTTSWVATVGGALCTGPT